MAFRGSGTAVMAELIQSDADDILYGASSFCRAARTDKATD